MGLVFELERREMSMWKARQSRQLAMTEDQYEGANKAVRPTVFVMPQAAKGSGEGE